MLAALNHPNVLRFYGVVTASPGDQTVVGIMTEFMNGSSLSNYLRYPPQADLSHLVCKSGSAGIPSNASLAPSLKFRIWIQILNLAVEKLSCCPPVLDKIPSQLFAVSPSLLFADLPKPSNPVDIKNP